jgi:arabinose-5-phosphate isomerase
MTVRLVAAKARLNDRPSDFVLGFARDCLLGQSHALMRTAHLMNAEFSRAASLLLNCTGRVIVSGIGKSGLVGRAIVATLACSGTPSAFLHPSEAVHGDLGMVTRNDVLMLISNSGETEEIVRLLPHFHDLGCPIIALVGRTDSSLARSAAAVLDVSVERESCPHNLVPTTSTLTTLAMGDALAMAATQQRDLASAGSTQQRPGSLEHLQGATVKDLMRADHLPLAASDESLRDALLTMSASRTGLVIVVDSENHPIGIVTDGDVRRAAQRDPSPLELRVGEIMTSSPVVIRQDATPQQAEARMMRLQLSALVVVDNDDTVVGLVEVFSRA